MSLKDRIRSRGYWEIEIRPVSYDRQRIRDLVALERIVRQSAVELRGWDFPHVGKEDELRLLETSLQHRSTWQHHADIWRLYQSGQFVCITALPEDWRELSEWWPAPEGWRFGSRLELLDSLFSLREFYEFAARLSATEAGDDPMVVTISFGNFGGRTLYLDSPYRWGLRGSNMSAGERFTTGPQVLSRASLQADPVSPALATAERLYQRFGRKFEPSELAEFLKDLRRA